MGERGSGVELPGKEVTQLAVLNASQVLANGVAVGEVKAVFWGTATHAWEWGTACEVSGYGALGSSSFCEGCDALAKVTFSAVNVTYKSNQYYKRTIQCVFYVHRKR